MSRSRSVSQSARCGDWWEGFVIFPQVRSGENRFCSGRHRLLLLLLLLLWVQRRRRSSHWSRPHKADRQAYVGPCQARSPPSSMLGWFLFIIFITRKLAGIRHGFIRRGTQRKFVLDDVGARGNIL